jgi:hypothetical protein
VAAKTSIKGFVNAAVGCVLEPENPLPDSRGVDVA